MILSILQSVIWIPNCELPIPHQFSLKLMTLYTLKTVCILARFKKKLCFINKHHKFEFLSITFERTGVCIKFIYVQRVGSRLVSTVLHTFVCSLRQHLITMLVYLLKNNFIEYSCLLWYDREDRDKTVFYLNRKWYMYVLFSMRTFNITTNRLVIPSISC